MLIFMKNHALSLNADNGQKELPSEIVSDTFGSAWWFRKHICLLEI